MRKLYTWPALILSILLLSAAALGLPAPLSAADPVLVGAGDIANCDTGEDEDTATLLDGIAGTVYTLGDNAYPDGAAEDYRDCYDPNWGRHKARTRPSPGNHEYHTPGAAGYFDYFGANAGPAGKGFYSYNLGAWHIVSLNSEVDADTGSEQERWLRADLAASAALCTVAYFHKPLFSSGSGHGNDPTMKDIWDVLYEYGADVVLSGHDHNYERFAPQDPNGRAAPGRGIREFVVGTGGTSLRGIGTIRANSEVRNSNTHGVLQLTLHSASYDWEFVPIAGKTFRDSGTAACVSTTPPPATTTPTTVATNTPTSVPGNSPTPTDTPLPGATATPTQTAQTPLPGQTVRLPVIDGWDQKNGKLLSEDGKVYIVEQSDNQWMDVEAGYFASFRFEDAIPGDAVIRSVKIFVEHYEEEGISARPLVWEAGTGSLTNLAVRASRQPAILAGESNEKTVQWDVTQWLTTPDDVNDLKLRIRNNATNGKKTKLDQVYVVVSFSTPGIVPTVTPTVPTATPSVIPGMTHILLPLVQR